MSADAAWMLGFVLTGSIMILISIWTGWLAYKANRNRYNLKNESYKHQAGGFKHFWYRNRFKMWWYITFVLLLFGAILIAVGAGVNPYAISTPI